AYEGPPRSVLSRVLTLPVCDWCLCVQIPSFARYASGRLDFTFRRCRGVSTVHDRRRRRNAQIPGRKNESRKAMSDVTDDFTLLDDAALLTWRARVRAELERLPSGDPGHAALAARYDQSTQEVNERARQAWSRAN